MTGITFKQGAFLSPKFYLSYTAFTYIKFIARTFYVIYFYLYKFLGAPGFSENPLKSELNQEITIDLRNIIKAMEVLAQQMITKRKLNANFLKIVELRSDPKAGLVKSTLDGSGEFIM